MKVFFAMLLLSSLAFAGIKGEFPQGPDASITPGSLCTRPDSYRYEEHIPYCKRDVAGDLKRDVFTEYRNLGWGLNPSKRSEYKIDHLIPLCAGGSNEEDNLWPQHKTIYAQTDEMENIGCQRLRDGKIKQAELVKMILAAKHNLSLVPQTMKFLNNL